MSETGLTETADPDEAFGALANAARVDILRALWYADDQTATFSELRDAVEMDDSGQFNYHLDKLTDRFVTKGEDGYELTLAGRAVNGAIHAGAYTMDGSIDPMALSDPCPACGGERTFHYEDERVRVECDSCDMTATALVPPGVFADYDREQFPAVTSRYFRTIYQQLANGFCWHCEGKIHPTVVPLPETTLHMETIPDDAEDLPLVQYDCQRCGAELIGDLGAALLSHPAVVSFYHDCGIDVNERPFWEFSAWNTDHALIRQRDPFRASVTYRSGDATLTLVVDESLNVVDHDRRDSG
ncbi:winged helix-turn-helix domain-containing protein [Haloarcula amylovorans]|uniref:winged helix-turn-helix domain-containing protein n=1 Tax=Haloarcula amylovorans TaxID=2562280 RepID=UPI0010765449|nr:helix-turn-helix domain-containing protein [Halomicroarcula amylolytica]